MALAPPEETGAALGAGMMLVTDPDRDFREAAFVFSWSRAGTRTAS